MAQGAAKLLDVKVGGLKKFSQFALTLTFVLVGKQVFCQNCINYINRKASTPFIIANDNQIFGQTLNAVGGQGANLQKMYIILK